MDVPVKYSPHGETVSLLMGSLLARVNNKSFFRRFCGYRLGVIAAGIGPTKFRLQPPLVVAALSTTSNITIVGTTEDAFSSSFMFYISRTSS